MLKRFTKFLQNIFMVFGKILSNFKMKKDLKIDFLIGPFLLQKIAINFAKKLFI